MIRYILFIESDARQREAACEALQRAFPGATVALPETWEQVERGALFLDKDSVVVCGETQWKDKTSADVYALLEMLGMAERGVLYASDSSWYDTKFTRMVAKPHIQVLIGTIRGFAS